MPPYSLRRLLWGGPASTVAAVLANLLYYGVTKVLGEHYLMLLEGVHTYMKIPMSVVMPVILTLLAGLLATIFFGLLIRFAHRPATFFLSVYLAALSLSFGGPFNLPAASIQTKILLSGMHIIAAGVITSGILILSHEDRKIP